MNAYEAIARSISHNEIVTLRVKSKLSESHRHAWHPELMEDPVVKDLLKLSEDFTPVYGEKLIEFWGTHEGRGWRVHARLEG